MATHERGFPLQASSRGELYITPIREANGAADHGRTEPKKNREVVQDAQKQRTKERVRSMVVFGRTKEERAGNILFQGTLEECQEYAAVLNPFDFDMLSICEDNGVIKEKIVEYGLPA